MGDCEQEDRLGFKCRNVSMSCVTTNVAGCRLLSQQRDLFSFLCTYVQRPNISTKPRTIVWSYTLPLENYICLVRKSMDLWEELDWEEMDIGE